MSVFAVSDLHGQLDLYNQITNFLKPEDKVYFLGDAADRGPQGWETLKAIAANKQFIYIKGNHEDMLEQAMVAGLDDPWPLSLLAYNGGLPTYEAWADDSDKEKWIDFLKNLPLKETYINKEGKTIYLSHAGFTPGPEEPTEQMLIWDRDHFSDDWDMEEYKDTYVVFGHSPIQLYGIENFGTWRIPETNKIGIDNGAFASNGCVLLDLDTFEEHIFKIED